MLKLKEAMQIVQHLEEKRTHEDEHAKKISDKLLPYRGFWPGDADSKEAIYDRGKDIINPAGTLALERAGGGFSTNMTPEGLPWFSLRTDNDELMEMGDVRQFFDVVEKQINRLLSKGSFYQAIHDANIDLFGFGNMLLFMDFHEEKLARFEAKHFGTYAISLNSDNELDTVVCRYRYTLKDLANDYGENKLCEANRDRYKENKYTEVDVVHVVRPNKNFKRDEMGKMSMAYESILYEDVPSDTHPDKQPKDVLTREGFHEMPYFFAPYSSVGGSDYGMGPGHLMMGHVLQLNEEERQKIIALQKMVNPPIRKPSDMKNRANVAPGGETAVGKGVGRDGLAPLYEVNLPVQYMQQEINDVEMRIAAVAKADLFYDLPMEMRPKDMTATEYMERKRERIQQIAPVVSIYEPTVLDKVIETAFHRLDRAGFLPPPPDALVEAGAIEVEYVSVVAKALRQSGSEATQAFLGNALETAAAQVQVGEKPTALLKVDVPQAMDEIHRGLGAPASILLDDERFEAKLAEIQQAEAKAMQAQQEAMQAESAAKVGNIKTQGTLAEQVMESGEA